MSFESAPSKSGAATTRRVFLQTAAAATTLLVGFRIPTAGAQGAGFAPNAFVRIDERGDTTLIIPQVEMGQGIYTALAMILGDELDIRWDSVKVQHAPPNDALYSNPEAGLQVTGNSNSVRAFWTPLRTAGASARLMLIAAAAQRWGVEASECRTENGAVFHMATGRTLDYTALVAGASRMPQPAAPPLKRPADFRLIGKPLKRLDAPDKVNGKAIYGIDARPAGLRFATLSECPVFGGKVQAFDDSRARQVEGVRQVVVLDDLVAVVGDNMWAAKQGLASLSITWEEGPNAALTSDALWQRMRAASEAAPGVVVAKSVGDTESGLARGERYDASYELPFLAHAQLEPLNCTVHVRPDSCEVWVGTQVLTRAQAAAARVTGLAPEKVTVHNHLLGGAFGRRLEIVEVEKAVRIAKEVEGPLKVVWTREEDIQHDVFRPMYHDHLTASVVGGRILSWTHRITGPAILARWIPPAFRDGIDFDVLDGAVDVPYDIPNLLVDFVRHELTPVPTGWWRGVGPNNNVFAVESFIDELATATRVDPVEFRRQLLGKSPRLLSALDVAAERADWGAPLPARTGRGIAVQVSFRSFVATVAEVEVSARGEVRVLRLVSAVDTGIVVNPDTVVAQLQGGLNFGVSAALYGAITIDRGRIQQSNFHDYRVLRISEAPAIDVHLINSDEAPGGIGETGTNAAPPAICNAIFAATGVRVRRLPIDPATLAQG